MTHTHTDRTARAATRKVVIVNGTADVLGLLEAVLDAGRYDMIFAASAERAYSQIRRVQPDLIVLCASMDDMTAFHLLTMLKIDPETRQIPVVTYATDFDGDTTAAPGAREADEDGAALSAARPAAVH